MSRKTKADAIALIAKYKNLRKETQEGKNELSLYAFRWGLDFEVTFTKAIFIAKIDAKIESIENEMKYEEGLNRPEGKNDGRE